MSAEPAAIFVYGTLMGHSHSLMGRAERERLHQAAQSLGPATVPGLLVDLGAYPGLIAPRLAGDVVHGEVLSLADPATVFRWLDDYEGIRSTVVVPAAGEYERVVRDARLDDGTVLAVWLYLFVAPSDGLPLVHGGRWFTQR